MHYLTRKLESVSNILWLAVATFMQWKVISRKKIIHLSQGFYRFRFLLHTYFFSFSLKIACLPCQLRKAHTVPWATNRFVGSETPKRNAKFHFVHFARNSWFFSFYRPSSYLYLFKNPQQTFSWPGEGPSSHLRVTKMEFGPNIKYLSESFFADFCRQEGISCWA